MNSVHKKSTGRNDERDMLQWMTTPVLAIATVLALALSIYFNVVAAQEFFATGYPVSLFESQLTFSAETIKGYHAVVMAEGSMELYQQVQIVDFGLMFATGLFLVLMGVLISRGFTKEHAVHRLAIVGGLIAGSSTLWDAVENGFLLTMLTDPLGFANWLALAYSAAAAVKLAFFIIGLLCMFAALVVLIYQSIWRRGPVWVMEASR